MNKTVKCSVCSSESQYLEDKNNNEVYCCPNCGTLDVKEK